MTYGIWVVPAASSGYCTLSAELTSFRARELQACAAPEELQRLTGHSLPSPDFVTHGIWFSTFLLPLPASFRPELTYTRNGVGQLAAPVESRSTDHSAQSSVTNVE